MPVFALRLYSEQSSFFSHFIFSTVSLSFLAYNKLFNPMSFLGKTIVGTLWLSSVGLILPPQMSLPTRSLALLHLTVRVAFTYVNIDVQTHFNALGYFLSPSVVFVEISHKACVL